MSARYLIFTLLLLVTGCGGVKDLGVWDLPDGQQVNAYQVRSKGATGPTITAIGLFLCNPTTPCEPLQGYHAASGGLLESITGGVVSTMIQAGVTYGVGTALVRQTGAIVTQEGDKTRDVTVKENAKKEKAEKENLREKIKADKETAKDNRSIIVTTPGITVIAPQGEKGEKGDKGDKGAK